METFSVYFISLSPAIFLFILMVINYIDCKKIDRKYKK